MRFRFRVDVCRDYSMIFGELNKLGRLWTFEIPDHAPGVRRGRRKRVYIGDRMKDKIRAGVVNSFPVPDGCVSEEWVVFRRSGED